MTDDERFTYTCVKNALQGQREARKQRRAEWKASCGQSETSQFLEARAMNGSNYPEPQPHGLRAKKE